MANELTVQVRSDLERMSPQFAVALPRSGPVTVEKFLRVVQTAYNESKDLQECTRDSVLASALKCASDGLVPDGKEAALVKYNVKVSKPNEPERWEKQARYMPMIAGILKKIRNSGEVTDIGAHIVREHDVIRFWVDDRGEHFEFTPTIFGRERGAPIGVFAFAILKDGGKYFEPMDVADLERVRAVSKAKDSGPWRDWPDEMWKKTAMRRLSKRLPMSTDVLGVIRSDDDLYDLSTPSNRDDAPAQAATAGSAAQAAADINAEATRRGGRPRGARNKPQGQTIDQTETPAQQKPAQQQPAQAATTGSGSAPESTEQGTQAPADSQTVHNGEPPGEGKAPW